MSKRYKVLVGSHAHGGRIFKKDEVIITNVDLVAMFGEKFEDMGPSDREDVFSDTPAKPTEPKGSDLPGRVALPRKASLKGG